MDPVSRKPEHAKRGVPLRVNVAGNELIGIRSNTRVESKGKSPDTGLKPGEPRIPVISVTPHPQPLSAEQHSEDLEASPAIQQSQGSYSFLSSEEYDFPGSPSSHALDSSEEELYRDQHRLDYGWHTDTEYERRSVIEEPDNELVLSPTSTSSQKTSSGSKNHVATAPFGSGGLPALGSEESLQRHRAPSIVSDLGQRMHYEDRNAQQHHRDFSTPGDNTKASDSERSIQDRLGEKLRRRGYKTPPFFPVNSILDIVTEGTVWQELRKSLPVEIYDREAVSEFARQICAETPYEDFDKTGARRIRIRSFRKIFVILVMIGKTNTIVKFLRDDVNDSDLPLKAHYGPTGALVADLSRRKFPNSSLKCFSEGWDMWAMTRFEEMQWSTLAPFFARSNNHKKVRHYPLESQVILPFVRDGPDDGSDLYEVSGGGGRVFKAKIHPNHHSFHDTHCKYSGSRRAVNSSSPALPTESECPCQFAVKELHSCDQEKFNNEVEMLVKFSKDGDPHLVSLLATYEQSQYFYLIFPWAEANLRDYWEVKNPNPDLDKQTVLWVAEQCKGIARGVLKIHQYASTRLSIAEANHHGNFQCGHHGDIKPENVLWFPDTHEIKTGPSRFQRGTLKLADFGLAAINPNRTVSRNVGEFSLSRPYCPPEADLMNGGGPGRQYDMWTLGCLYLEFITWLIGGWTLVSAFQCARLTRDQNPRFFDIQTPTFFQTEEGPAGKVSMIKPQVTKFIDSLHAHPKCTEFLHEFLNMVQQKLLIVKKNGREELNRYTSEQVHVKLTKMLEKLKKSEAYGCEPCPRKRT